MGFMVEDHRCDILFCFLAENAQIIATSALALSLGIAIQNFPEGAIRSMPLRTEGESKRKALPYLLRWGQMHQKYLKEHCSGRYSSLLLTGRLWTYLANVRFTEQAENRFECIVDQMKAAEGVTEELKRQDAMLWVRRCNNIRNRAEEIIRAEMIYCK